MDGEVQAKAGQTRASRVRKFLANIDTVIFIKPHEAEALTTPILQRRKIKHIEVMRSS